MFIHNGGIEGLAETSRGKILSDIVKRRLRDELVGQDPLQKKWLWHRSWETDRIEEIPLYILGLVDVALWDITVKKAGLLLYQILWPTLSPTNRFPTSFYKYTRVSPRHDKGPGVEAVVGLYYQCDNYPHYCVHRQTISSKKRPLQIFPISNYTINTEQYLFHSHRNERRDRTNR